MDKSILYSTALGILGVGYLGKFDALITAGYCMIAVITLGALYIYRLVLWDKFIMLWRHE